MDRSTTSRTNQLDGPTEAAFHRPPDAVPGPRLGGRQQQQQQQLRARRRLAVEGRTVGFLVDPDDLIDVPEVRDVLITAGVVPVVVARRQGELNDDVVADRTTSGAGAAEFDALLVAGAGTTEADPALVDLLAEARRYGKLVGAWGAGVAALQRAGITPGSPDVVVAEEPDEAVFRLLDRLATV